MQKQLDLRDISVHEAADFLGGTIEGNEDASFTMVARIEDAGEGMMTFLANPKYSDHIYTTSASIVLINSDLELKQKVDTTLIRVEDAYIAFCKILNKYFNPSTAKTGIEGTAFVSEKASVGEGCYVGNGSYISDHATIGNNCKIYPNTFIGENVTIGDNALIYPNVSIYHDSKIGSNVIIHSGVVIGSDGFGHARQKDGSYIKIPQIGNVEIEDDVEIGSNTTIDRATMGSTIVRKGAKLDNLIMVAHNVEIGEHTVIAGQTGISGSTKLGSHCVIAGQVGFAGHLKIAKGSQIGAQSGINKDIKEEGKAWFGTPYMPLRDALRSSAMIKSLPQMQERLNNIEHQLKENKE